MKNQLFITFEPQQVLVWTCVLVFILTSLITLLGIIKKIAIDPVFLKKLFITLILEIISIGVLSFKNSFNPKPIAEFIKIVSPINGFSIGTNNILSVYGAYNKSSDEKIIGKLISNKTIINLNNTSNDNNIFYTNLDTKLISNYSKIVFSITKNNNEVIKDSIIIKK